MSFADLGDNPFRLAVESSPAAMIVASSDGVIQFANAETERMFGYPADELAGRSIDILVPSRLRHGHVLLRQSFIAAPSKRPMGAGRDLRARKRDGSEFPVEIGLTPIEASTGLLVLATVIDVSPRREAERSLEQRANELERANERLDRFAYVASHDLQEPLRKIVAFSELLEQAIAATNQSEMIYANHVIRTSALRARELVNDLLTYSRTINDAQQLCILDLKDEIQLALDDLSELISETGAVIEVEVSRITFKADRSQFARLMHNIISNAIKYRKPDQISNVRITATQLDGDAIRLAIVDDGIGFEAKYADAIFEPFKRLHTRTQYPGTGIGLAICKSIVDRHGWSISIDSSPGAGATFFITMPTLPPDTPRDRVS
jgi:PAS domain S-box-containing protein